MSRLRATLKPSPVATLWFAVATCAAGSASAAEPREPWKLSAHIDLPVTVFSLAIGGAPALFRKSCPPPSCSPECDPDNISLGVDRWVVGHHSLAARRWSDRLLAAQLTLPLLFVLVDGALGSHLDSAWTDTALLVETASVNLALNTVTKHAVRRPRPLAYDSALSLQERTDANAGLSFYSGHSSTAFAMATAYSTLFAARHPDSDWVVPVWALSESIAATTAGLRVAAGKHFWSDVAVGAAVGASVGYLVPRLHRVDGSGGSASGSPAAWRLAPAPTADGPALVVSWP